MAAANPAIFPDAGIAVARCANAFLSVTCGTNGMNGRGGHGHNDKLGFELHIGGSDFVVDGGCPAYTADCVMRNRYRSTRMHSTVSVDDMEQDPLPRGMNGLFLLPQTCRPKLWITPARHIAGEHSGFGAVHRRLFRLGSAALEIDDTLETSEGVESRMHFNFDPEIRCTVLATDGDIVACELRHSCGKVVRLEVSGGRTPMIDAGSFSIAFGVPVPNQRLSVMRTRTNTTARFSWSES